MDLELLRAQWSAILPPERPTGLGKPLGGFRNDFS